MKKEFFILLIISFSLQISCNEDKIDIPKLDQAEKGFEGSKIPFIVISTGGEEIINEPKIPANMAIYIDQQEVFQSPIGIEERGSTSRLLFPKKSYGIETWDETGADKSIEILGFPKEEDWILYGPYSDKTFFRNVLIYQLSNEIGRWAPGTQFVELSINGMYQGLYVFMEKIKRDRYRLDLQELNPAQTHNDVISGGYILKIDKTSGDTDISGFEGDYIYTENLGFRSDYDPWGNIIPFQPYGPKQGSETYFLYEYPDWEVINNKQKDYIRNYISEFEDALVNVDYSSQERAYEQYIDVSSFVDFLILNELAGNPDAYRLSTFLHKDRNGKLKIGPVWDFNIAFGNDGRSRTDQWIFMYNLNYPGDLWQVHFWWERLVEDPKFRQAVKSRWNELKSDKLRSGSVNSQLDNWYQDLESNGSIRRNYQKWPVIGETLPFNSFVGSSYKEEVDYLKTWYEERWHWMDDNINGW